MIPDIDDTVFRSVFGTFRIPINEMVTLIVLKPILITIVLLSFFIAHNTKDIYNKNNIVSNEYQTHAVRKLLLFRNNKQCRKIPFPTIKAIRGKNQ